MEFCEQVNLSIDGLFIHGEFEKYTAKYGEHDWYHFQDLYTNWNSVEDYKWIDAIYVGRLILMLPHPAHAVFLFQQPTLVVPESVNAWAVAKRCGLEILDMRWIVRTMQRFCPKDGAIFHGKAPLDQFHETRSAEGWRCFSKGLIFLCTWWSQPEAPWLQGGNMQTATVALAKEEERIAFRNNEERSVVLNTVKVFFENYGSLIEYSDCTDIIRKYVALMNHYPNLKWRLARILHDGMAGVPTEIIEALRYKHGHRQYAQQYFASKRSLASESDKAKRMHAEMGEKLLQPFQEKE